MPSSVSPRPGSPCSSSRGAGDGAGFEDERYRAAGAEVAADTASLYQRAQVIARVAPPDRDELALLRSGTVVLGLFAPFGRDDLAPALAASGMTSLSMDLMPRITRAQSMDVLSSQATVAGYHAVLLGSRGSPVLPAPDDRRRHGHPRAGARAGRGRRGAAGHRHGPPARSRRVGLRLRPVAREQVEWLGAKFLEIELPEADTEDGGGYAKELSEEAHRREQELVARHVADSDVVVTTALIPGRPAPILVTAAMVDAMRPGSVIADPGRRRRRQLQLATAGETAIRHGVRILGPDEPGPR